MLQKSSACIPKYNKIVRSTEKNGGKFYNSKDFVLPMNIVMGECSTTKGQTGLDRRNAEEIRLLFYPCTRTLIEQQEEKRAQHVLL